MKKRPLAAGFVLLALVSASAGYFAGADRKSHTAKTPPIVNSPAQVDPPPSPIDGNSPVPVPSDRASITGRQDRSLVNQLALYASMTPDQLAQEMARWNSWPRSSTLNDDQRMVLSYLASRWGRVAPRQAMEYLKGMNPALDLANISEQIMTSWAKTNPEAAAAYFSEHRGDIPGSGGVLANIAWEMGQLAPANTLQWAKCLSEDEWILSMPVLLRSLSRSRPEELPDYFNTLVPKNRQTAEMCKILSYTWASTDWEAAKQWIDTLEGPQKDQAWRSALTGLSSTDPEKMTSEFKKWDSRAQSSAITAITSGMMQESPTQALQWLTENTSEELATKGILHLFRFSFEQAENSAFREYAVSMNEGPLKDSVMEQLIQCGSRPSENYLADFESLLPLTENISNPEIKKKSLDNIFRNWRRSKDPQKAKSIIESSSLPEEEKKKYLEKN